MTIQLNWKTPTKIAMRKPWNNFATQWPCPDGFHVPTKDELTALVAAMRALWINTLNGNCMKTYLKMPFAGYRRAMSATAKVNNAGSYGYYWSSTVYNADYANGLGFSSSSLGNHGADGRASGFSVRCFKNTPVALSTADIDYFDPDTQWPVIPWYETLYWNNDWIAWIYRDDTNWIITLSSDGETWITISDKSLWATTVYNDWDTLSEANCGYFYQWWNNYGFPWTWSVTTSSTQVDASWYGPWNYYSSNTFIIGSNDWSSVQNDNLRWWEDWNVPMLEEKEIKKIVIFPDGVTEKQIRPTQWKPWANTLLYLPLESDVVDMSWQATTRVFNTNSLTYTTVDNVPSVHIWSTGWIKLTTPYPLVPKTDTYPCTVSVLVYTTNTNTKRCILDMAAKNWNRQGILFETTNKLSMSVYNDTNDSSYATLQATPTLSQWNHIVYTITTTSSKLYVNWVLVDSWAGNPNYPRWNRPYSHDNTQWIFCTRDVNKYTSGLNWNARELIFEKKEWTADEVSNYYTWIKSKLGF